MAPRFSPRCATETFQLQTRRHQPSNDARSMGDARMKTRSIASASMGTKPWAAGATNGSNSASARRSSGFMSAKTCKAWRPRQCKRTPRFIVRRESMRKVLSIAAVLAACAPTVTTSPARAPALDFASPDARATAASIDGFAADLHAALPKTGNLFYSPASVAIALGMAEQGAAGQTRAEMDKVLHLSGGPLAYASLESALASSKSPEIGIADRLYFEKTIAIEPAFAK